MLAATGVMGLLLMGVAVSGLMAGTDAPANTPDDDQGPDTEDGGTDASGNSAEPAWTGDFAEDGSMVGPQEPDPTSAPLAELLFGEEPLGDDAPSGGLQLISGGTLDTSDTVGEADEDNVFADLDLSEDAETDPDTIEITETVAYLGEPNLPHVIDFDADTDRLILDFEGTDDEAPEITVDHDTMAGHSVVMANGLAVTLVEGTDALAVDQVDVVMSGEPASGAQVLPFHGLLDGGTTSDALDGRAHLGPSLASAASDVTTGGPGNDALTTSAAGQGLFGNEGDDTLQGQGGNDAMYGDDGADQISGGGGIDFLSGDAGDDTLDGGDEDDLVFGGEGDDLLSGGNGNDGLQGGLGADTLLGGAGNDIIDGTFTHDVAYSGQDHDAGDLIDAGEGDDTIRIGANDTVSGGSGSDLFFAGDTNADGEVFGTIDDFNPNEDQIEILYDPKVISDPSVTVVDFEDGTGASILLNDAPILSVTGAQGLDPKEVVLRASNDLPALLQENA